MMRAFFVRAVLMVGVIGGWPTVRHAQLGSLPAASVAVMCICGTARAPTLELRMNTPHTVTISAPLLRPGLKISAVCSERYVVAVAARLMDLAREINAPAPGAPALGVINGGLSDGQV